MIRWGFWALRGLGLECVVFSQGFKGSLKALDDLVDFTGRMGS